MYSTPRSGARTERASGGRAPIRSEVGRELLLRVLPLVLAIRALVFAAGVVSVWLAHEGVIEPLYASGFPLVAWDSLYYREILIDGYPPAPSPLLAFFPAYPLAARLLTPALTPEVALLAVANACTLAGLAMAYVWGRAFVSPDVALAGTLLTAVYPPAAFLSAAYTDGPFLLLVAVTFFAMARQAWLGAALACGLATACRPTGLALAVVVWLGAAASHWRQRFEFRTLLKLAGLGLLAVSGLIAYEIFMWIRYGDPLVYLGIQSYWNGPPLSRPPLPAGAGEGDPISWGPGAIRDALASWPFIERRVTSLSVWNKGWTLLCLLVTGMGLVAPGPLPRLLFGVPLLIFLIAYVPQWGAGVHQVRLLAIARYETAALPCFFLVAWWLRARPRATGALVVALLALQLLYAAAISRGWWAG